MKSYLVLLFCIGAAISCKPKVELNIRTVTSKFKEATNRIEKVEYNMHRIDTFASGTVWNNKGYALIEKDSSDDLFGFSFYGRRHDVPSEFIYDDGKTFVVSIHDKKYEIGPSNYGFLGSPGGQMVSRQIFYLDSAFTSAEVVESDDRFTLKYKFADDTTYNVTDKTKVVELNKSNFLPIRITETSKLLGKKSVSQIYFSDMKINGEVKNSIRQHKDPLVEFELVQPEIRQANSLLNASLPLIALADVRNANTTIRIQPGKVTLIDFWEVWCGPCIKSLPDVEKLHSKFPEKLQVVGIVTERPEDAILLLNKKRVTYQNLVGSKELLKQYGVNAIPYYLLVDTKGVVTNEFIGFSPEIEKTIRKLVQGE